jgi:cytidylate kinase
MREHHDPKEIVELVDDQCVRWEKRNRMFQESRGGDIQRPVLILSGEVGTRVKTVAERLSRELNMDLFGEEILHEIAREAHLSERIVRTMDERGWTYADEILKRLMGKEGMSAEDYFRHLVRVIVTIGRHGNSVILGHGAAYILRGPMNLHVRFVAPMNLRIQGLSEELGISAEEAHRRIRILDKERRDFAHQYFHTEIDDVRYFDLVINNEFIDTDMAVRLVKDAFVAKNWQWSNRRSRPRHGATKGEDRHSGSARGNLVE